MKAMVLAILDVLVQWVIWFPINLVFKGNFEPPTIDQLTFSMVIILIIRSHEKGGAA